MSKSSFALSSTPADITALALEVKTRKWASENRRHLKRHATKFAKPNVDSTHYEALLKLLCAAFGKHVGEQVSKRLGPFDMAKIRIYVVQSVYR